MKECKMKESRIVISEVMMPSQANPNGNVHGGEIMKLMDSAAYAAAQRYVRSNVVTARVDELEFHLPIRIGDLVRRHGGHRLCRAQLDGGRRQRHRRGSGRRRRSSVRNT